MARLSRWFDEGGLGGHDLTPAEAEGFLQARLAAGSRQWLSSRGMSPLLGYLREVGFAASGSHVVASTPMEILLADYRDYLVSERGLAAWTVLEEASTISGESHRELIGFSDWRASAPVAGRHQSRASCIRRSRRRKRWCP